MPAKKKFPPPNAKQATGSNAKSSVADPLAIAVPQVPEGLYRSILINAGVKTFSKEEAQVASVMTNIFSNLEDLSRDITHMFQDFNDATILQLNIDLNQGQEKTFIVFERENLPPKKKGTAAPPVPGELIITDRKPEQLIDKQRQVAQAQKSVEGGYSGPLLGWLEANGNKPTRETLSAVEQSIINALLLFYFNLYKDNTYKLIIRPYFTTILSSLLSKGYSDSAIFLEAAKQKFEPGPGQELSVNIPQSSDKLASLLASYINGFAIGIRKTPKTQDAYIMIMDEDILRFLVDITTGQKLSDELDQMLKELYFIDINGTDLRRDTDNIIHILRGIKDLKFRMQQTLLQKDRLGPEQILNLSFRELADIYTKDFRNSISREIFGRDFNKYLDNGISIISSRNQNPKDQNYIELKIIKNYFTLQVFRRQMRDAFLTPPQEASAFSVSISPSKEDDLHVSTILSEEKESSSTSMEKSLATPIEKVLSSDSEKASVIPMGVSSSSEVVQAPQPRSESRQFYSFLLVLFFWAFPNLKDIRGQQSLEEAKHRAIFSAFYDFLNGHDFKIKNLLYVVDIVLPEFFSGSDRRLLNNVSNYHEDEEAILRFSGARGKVTFLVNDDMWETQFTYYDNNNNLLNSSITDDMIRTCPTLELFELIPYATKVTAFNDFKVGKEVAGPQLNTLKRDIILSIKEYVETTPCQARIDSDDCVDYVMSRIFFRVTDAVTLVSMFDSGSPPLFAAKYLISSNPEGDGTIGQNHQKILISTGDGTLLKELYENNPFFPTIELIKGIYTFLTVDIVRVYPNALKLSRNGQKILSSQLFPLNYKTWFDQWIYFLFLQLKTPASNELAIGKKRTFLVSLVNKYINQKPPILLSGQMEDKKYYELLNFFQRMQKLSDQVKLTKSQKSGKQVNPQTQQDLTYYNENPDQLYAVFFAALFDAFRIALASQDPEVRYHDLNKLFEFISLFVDDAPKSMGEVLTLNNIKQEINKKMFERTQHCQSLRARGPPVTPTKQGTQKSSLKKAFTMGGSRRRIKHAHKYKKLTKKRRVKKHKTKKYNRHKK